MARRVLLGVTGGIAAYKACELCRLFVQAGHEVTPVLTAEAEGFVTARTFEALARREQPRELYPHLVDADLLVIAPLSANTLAKLAHGLADNVLTQLALAFRGPLLVGPGDERPHVGAPGHAGERRARCASAGCELIGPEEGELAEGETGLGRMSEPEAIFARVAAAARRDRHPRREDACWSARAARASRSTRCATSGIARPAAWASRSPRRRAGAAHA